MQFTKFQGLGTKGIPFNTNWPELVNQRVQVVSEKTHATSIGFYKLKEPYERKDINVLSKHCVIYDLDHPTSKFDELVDNLKFYEALILFRLLLQFFRVILNCLILKLSFLILFS
jgi:hypothetical protein